MHYGIAVARGIGTNKGERLPAQKPGGRYKSGPHKCTILFLTCMGRLEHRFVIIRKLEALS